MFTSAIKKQTSVFCSISLNPYMVFQTWNHGEKKKRKAILLLACIVDVSCLTNRFFYMRTSSLIFRLNNFLDQLLFGFAKIIYVFCNDFL